MLSKVPKILSLLDPLVLDYHAQSDLHLNPLGQTKVIKC